jgi:hypothetical protein
VVVRCTIASCGREQSDDEDHDRQAEIGVHPSDGPKHEISLMCDDLDSTMAELRGHGVVFQGEAE